MKHAYLGIIVIALVLVPTAALAAAPSNDDLADAAAITALPYSNTVDVAEATTETGEPSGCGTPDRSVWYRHRATRDGVLVASTAGSDFDTVTAVYEGPQSSLSALGCDDDGGGSKTSVLAFEVAEDRTYFIQVFTARYTDDKVDSSLTFSLRRQPTVTTTTDDDGWVDVDNGRMTVTGTAACSQTIPVRVTVTATQDVPDGRVSDSSVAYLTCDRSMRWQVSLKPYSGVFTPGPAKANVYVTAPTEAISSNYKQDLEVTGCTRVGTVGSDEIDGTSSNDRICSLAGNDTVASGGGDDVVFAEIGDDAVRTGGGNDKVFGGSGTDTVSTAGGSDAVLAGPGGDVVGLGSGPDQARGGTGRDRILGEAGADVIYGEERADVLNGEDGTDKCVGGGGDDRFSSCETKVQ